MYLPSSDLWCFLGEFDRKKIYEMTVFQWLIYNYILSYRGCQKTYIFLNWLGIAEQRKVCQRTGVAKLTYLETYYCLRQCSDLFPIDLIIHTIFGFLVAHPPTPKSEHTQSVGNCWKLINGSALNHFTVTHPLGQIRTLFGFFNLLGIMDAP